MKLTLKLLAPYFAVGIFWCLFANAWLALIAYHAQILFWSRGRLPDLRLPARKRMMLWVIPFSLAGPVLSVLLPIITRTELSVWLIDHHLSRLPLLLMIPYFGLVHPLLEQIHWTPLRKKTPAAHVMFAGYHLLVLYSLLSIPWLLLCFVSLAAASFLWRQMAKQSHGIGLSYLTHLVADLGVILAAWLSVGS